MISRLKGAPTFLGLDALGGRAREIVRLMPWEVLVWMSGLLAMATMDPEGAHLFRLCPLDLLGFTFCPGCGLGHSIAYLVRGAFADSLQAHPLGAPAVAILVGHCGRLVRHAYQVSTRHSLLF